MSKEWPRWMVNPSGQRKAFASEDDVTEGWMTVDQYAAWKLKNPDPEPVSADQEGPTVAEDIARRDARIEGLEEQITTLGDFLIENYPDAATDAADEGSSACEVAVKVIAAQAVEIEGLKAKLTAATEAFQSDEDGKLTKEEIVAKLNELGVEFDGRQSRKSLFILLAAQPASPAA